jgi:hypothetical protein
MRDGNQEESTCGSDGKERRVSASREALGQTQEGNSEGRSSGPVGAKEGFVYFLQTEDGRFVKIGYSMQPYRRLSQLGTLRPGNHALRIIGWMPGTIQTERWLQSKFSADRDNGEWFRDSTQLRQFISSMGLIEPEPEREPEPEPEPGVNDERAMSEKLPLTVAELAAMGGNARARSLSKKRRKEIAKAGAAARWGPR